MSKPPTKESDAGADQAVNEELKIMQRKRKHQENYKYSQEERFKIAKYAAENGNSAAIRAFSPKLGFDIPESTVRSMKKVYLEQLKDKKGVVNALPLRKMGRPLKLGATLDKTVQR